MRATARDTSLSSPGRLAGLTRRYARFSLSAGGLASVLGGALALLAYFVGALAPPDGPWGRGALAVAPFAWIGAKELLRRRYYQPFGRVQEIRTDRERRWHLGLTLFTALVSVGVVGLVAWRTWTGGGGMPPAGTVGYLAIVASMPVLVWFFMKTPLEFVVGVFLVCQAALMVDGSHYALWEQPQAPLAAVVLMGVGARQHLEFRRLRRELERTRAGSTADE